MSNNLRQQLYKASSETECPIASLEGKAADYIGHLEEENKQLRRSLGVMREVLATATNSNLVDFIDAVLTPNEAGQ